MTVHDALPFSRSRYIYFVGYVQLQDISCITPHHMGIFLAHNVLALDMDWT